MFEPLETRLVGRRDRAPVPETVEEPPALYPLVEAWNPSQHQDLFAFAQRGPDHREALVQRLSSEVGRSLAEAFLDRSLFRDMQELHEHLSQETYRGLPYIDQELSFVDTLVLAKTFGSPDRVDAFLDMYHPSDVDDRLTCAKEGGCLIVLTDFSKQKGLTARIVVGFDAQLPEGSAKDPAYRSDACLYTSETEGRWTSYYELDRLELAPELQSHGAGSKIFSRCLLWCLEQELFGVPVESLRLKANIDVGGYAWSLYGFDFDHEAWASDTSLLQERSRRDALSPVERRREIAETLLKKQGHYLDSALLDTHTEDPETTASLHEYIDGFFRHIDELLQDDSLCELVTPSLIASMGLEQPRLRQTDNGTFYLRSLPAGETLRREMHLGKRLLLDSTWYGRLALQPSDPHKNPALALAFKRLGIPL